MHKKFLRLAIAIALALGLLTAPILAQPALADCSSSQQASSCGGT